MKLERKKGRRRVLAGLLSVLMVLTNLETIPAMAAETDEIVSEVAETVEAETNASDLVINPDREGEDYSEGFEVWFNPDGTTALAAGQVGTYPVYAGEAMNAKTNKITVDGVDHYSVQGSTNPSRDGNNKPNGAIPDTGAYLKVVAPADGTITVYGYKSGGKPFYATKSAEADSSALITNAAFDNEVSYTIDVLKDEEWYFYAQGSKAQFVGVKFELPKASHDIPLSFAGEALGDTTITFTNTTTKAEVTVGATDTKVTLVESYVYSVKINSASLTIDIDSVSLKDSIPESITITVAVAAKHEVSGSFKGLPDGAVVTALSFTDEAGAETEVTVTGDTYTVSLKNGVYTAAATTDAAGYTVFDHVLVEGVGGEAISNDVWFYGEAPSYGTEYKATLKVGKAEGADYATISEAVAAAKAMTRSADQWVTLELTDEEYVEQVIVNTDNIKMVAAEGVTPEIRWYYGIGYKYYSIDSTGYYNVKNANDKFEMNYAQRWAAVVRVTGTGFIAEGINFVNTFNLYVCEEELGDSKVGTTEEYGQSISGSLQERTSLELDVANKTNVERAAAIVLDGDKAEFYDCSFISSQDTVYTGVAKAYFNNCLIEGQTDYIFGNPGCKAIFDSCELKWLGYTAGSKEGYITATKGDYLFRNCKITKNTETGYTVTPGYFGRPWDATAKVYFVGTSIEAGSMNAAGWYEMGSVKPEDVTFREYGNCIGSELSSEKANFFYSTYAADTENYEFALSKEAGEALADPAADADFLETWKPVHAITEAYDLSAVEEWSNVTDEDEGDEGDDSDKHGIGIDEAGTITKKYVIEGTSVAQMLTAGGKNDGDSEKAGTEEYFTVLYSSKTKIDKSDKSFEDGYSLGQRFNFGGTASTTKNAIKFTTSVENAAVSVWWAEGGEDNRQITILDSTGTAVHTTDGARTKNSAYISKFTLAQPGTYYLGSSIGNNYIFKVEVEESVTYVWEENTYILDTSADLTAFAAGAKADGDTEKAGTDKYFTVQYSAKSKVDSSNKSFGDGYAGTQRFNPGGKATTTMNSIKFTTNSANATVKVWWAEGGDDNRQMVLLDSTGAAAYTTSGDHTKNSAYKDTFTVAEAGTYYLGGGTNSNYIFKVEVTEKSLTTGKEEKPERKAWDEVAAPEILSVTQSEETYDITVSVSGNMGYDGADSTKVVMMDASGNEVATKNSSKEGDSVDLVFTCSSTGLYKFKAVSSRDEEETEKTSAETEIDYYVLKLVAPGIKTEASKGNGTVALEWESAKEATGYIVTVNGTELEPVYDAETFSTLLEGLTIGEKYTFGMKAVRVRTNPLTGEEVTDKSDIGATLSATVVDEIQKAWGFSVYGTSTDTKNNGYIGSVNDGKVTVYSEGGKGKIVPNSHDGLAFYYTKMNPETENFTLEGTVTVNNWTLSNGQDGFGMMVSDTIGVNGSTDTVWNNSYMALVSKVEYYVDKETGEVTTDTSASKITMKLGVGALARDGITTADIEYYNANKVFPCADGSTKASPENFVAETTTLETSCASRGTGTYNIIGNYTTDPGGTVSEEVMTTFVFSITRNNDGYIIQYKDLDGEVLGKKTIYDQERTALTQIDPENIYVGFFASRNARITVTDVKLTTIAPEDDAPAGDRPVEEVIPVYQIESSTFANSSDYDLVYYGNADGLVTIKDNKGNVIANDYAVTANTKVHFPTVLPVGTTTFTITVTPDPEFVPGDYKVLKTYDAKTFTHSVLFKTYAGSVIYVAPNGSAIGDGSKEKPLDIYNAVKYVQAGQKILLMEGTYNLSKTVKTERGISGREGEYIYMIADPAATTRPVLDFNGKCAGMILAGDYWYFKGFDVTKSQNAQKGIQVSGSNNVLEEINTYRNGNTGIQISRYKSTDLFDQWPSNNLILNCTSFLNADGGYEDADGFAAKLTVGEGNVFDGCISAYNADDGWDLYAKVETGNIGKVVIKNSVAFMNGYVLDENGNQINAGNGNGFKMGGESLSGYHTIINSVAFANKAKGIDSNSCPDIQAYNSTSFENKSYNIAFYTNNALNTDFLAQGVISYKKSEKEAEQLKPVGSQDETKYKNDTTFLFDGSKSSNASGAKVNDDWFVSLDTASVLEAFKSFINTGVYTTVNGVGITRNEDGTINMNGYLELTAKGKEAGAGATLEEKEDVAANEIAVYDVKVSENISDIAVLSILGTEGTKNELKEKLQAKLWNSTAFEIATPNANISDVAFYEINVYSLVNGEWVATDVDEDSLMALIPIPAETNREDYGYSLYAAYVSGEEEFDSVPEFTGAEIHLMTSGHMVVAVAYENYKLTVEEPESEWGDIIPEDQLLFDSAEDVSANYLWIAGIKDVDYTGKAIKQNFRVYNGKTLLASGKDYTASYKNNTKANDASVAKTAPTITITAKGNYSGTVKKYFKINPISISSNSIYASEFKVSPEKVVVAYNKKKQTPAFKLYRNGVALKSENYKVTYPDTMEGAYKEPGHYSVVITGRGNYTGSITLEYTEDALGAVVSDKGIEITKTTLISKASIASIAAQKYNGKEILVQEYDEEGKAIPVDGNTVVKLKLTYNKKLLNGTTAAKYKKLNAEQRAGYSYVYTISNNLEIGKATIHIEGKNEFTGSKDVTFTIKGYKLSDAKISGFKSSIPYTGSAIEQAAVFTGYTGTANEFGVYSYKKGTLVGVTQAEYDAMSEAAQRGVDYTISYVNNLEIGKATVVYTGVNAYTGTVKKSFNITGTKLDKKYVKNIQSSFVYTGRQITQDNAYIEYKGNVLEEGKDYIVSYKNNIKAGKAKVTFTGKGWYTGSVTKEYTIKAYNMLTDVDNRMAVTYNDAVEYAKKGAYASSSVKYTYAGITQTLVEGKDYAVSFSNNDKIAEDLSKLQDKYKPTIKIAGKNNFTGTVKNFFTIAKRDIATTIASASDVAANNKSGTCATTSIKIIDNQEKNTKADGTVVYNTNKLEASKDYKIAGYYYAEDTEDVSANTLVGKDIVKPGTKVYAVVNGNGKYEGSATVNFTVTKKVLSSASVSFASKVYYTGSEVDITEDMLKVTIGSGKNKKIVEQGEFRIVEGSLVNNVAKRQVTFTIEGVGDYGGKKTVTLTLSKKLFELFK